MRHGDEETCIMKFQKNMCVLDALKLLQQKNVMQS